MNTPSNRIIVTLILAGILFVMSCSQNEEPEAKKDPVQVTTALPDNTTTENIVLSGQVESRQTAVISTRVMGTVTGIFVKPGDKVAKGELLATISHDDMTAKMGQANAAFLEANAAMTDAEKDYERFSELFKQQSASSKELENARLHYTAMKAKTEAARQMQREIEAMLRYTNLSAPFSGVVVQKAVEPGSMAIPGQPILVLEQLSDFQIRATVPESEIANIKRGASADITIKSTGRSMKGEIFEVSPSSRFTGSQYIIKISIPHDQEEGLFSGMYANVSISVKDKESKGSSVLVPVSSIIYKDQLTGIYTVSQQQTALLRWVRLGKVRGDKVEVISGLNSQEPYILKSESKLYNGIPVAVR